MDSAIAFSLSYFEFTNTQIRFICLVTEDSNPDFNDDSDRGFIDKYFGSEDDYMG
ncbi:MAG: hypothetical protein ACFCAD_08920 [Pleurocapsa sp.]